MNNLLHKLFNKKTDSPSKHLQKSLASHFKNCRNIEWCLAEPNQPEAIFFVGDQEIIARLTPRGELLEYRVNLPLNSIPPGLGEYVAQHGELMNAIEIHKTGATVTYEIIVRDEHLTRFGLVVTSENSLIKKERL